MLDEPKSPETPKIIIGQQLPGITFGEGYINQVIPSEFGDLTYQSPQYRDGFIRWRTSDRKTLITVGRVNDTPGVVTDIEHFEEREPFS